MRTFINLLLLTTTLYGCGKAVAPPEPEHEKKTYTIKDIAGIRTCEGWKIEWGPTWNDSTRIEEEIIPFELTTYSDIRVLPQTYILIRTTPKDSIHKNWLYFEGQDKRGDGKLWYDSLNNKVHYKYGYTSATYQYVYGTRYDLKEK